MKRFLILAILIAAGVFFGGKFYYESQMKKNLDQLVQAAQVVGDFSYRDVNVTHTGEAQINHLRFQPHGANDAVLVDQVKLRTGNALGLFYLSEDTKKQQFPQHLGVSVSGLRVLTGGSVYGSSQTFSTAQGFDAMGCGNRQKFSGHDLMDMGYEELVMNIDLDYEIIGDGQKLRLYVRNLTEGVARLEITADIQLGASSRSAQVMAATFPRAALNSLDIEYEDLGYAANVIKFCAAEMGMAPAEYRTHHLAAWQDYWNRQGIAVGPKVATAYESFIQTPDRFSLYLYPATSLSLRDLFETPANILIYRLQGNLEVNDAPVVTLDLVGLTEEEQAQIVAQKEAEQDPVAAEPVVDPNLLSLDNLQDHLRKSVRVRLHNGKTYRGQIRAVEEGRIQFQRFEQGGHLVMPIQLDDIKEVRLTD